MKRRSFLGLLGGAVVAPAASLEAAPIQRPTDPSIGYLHDEPMDAYFVRTAPLRAEVLNHRDFESIGNYGQIFVSNWFDIDGNEVVA